MSIEMTVSEIAEILGVSRQAVNNRVKQLPEEDTEKNAKGVTVVKRSGLIKLEEIYKKTIFEDEPIDEETKQRELLEILVDEKNSEIARLYAQLRPRMSSCQTWTINCVSKTCKLLKKTSKLISSSN